MFFETVYDQNRYRQKTRALHRYFAKTYKYLIFEIIPKLLEENKKDGYYEIDLPVSELFKKVYGRMTFLFHVRDDRAYFEDITPNEILRACYEKELPVYNGMPYNTEKDLNKIKIVERLL